MEELQEHLEAYIDLDEQLQKEEKQKASRGPKKRRVRRDNGKRMAKKEPRPQKNADQQVQMMPIENHSARDLESYHELDQEP